MHLFRIASHRPLTQRPWLPFRSNGQFRSPRFSTISSPKTNIEQWKTSDVLEWARRIPGIEEQDIEKLKQQRLTGSSLFGLSEDRLTRWGIPFDPTIRILGEINKMKEDIILQMMNLNLPSLRTDFLLPRKTLKLAFFYFDLAYEREEALKEVLGLMYKRWRVYTERDKAPASDSERRTYNRLMGTFCCPGGGKTFFLDCISHLKDVLPEDNVNQLFVDVCKKEDIDEFKEWYNKLIFLPVSFNGETSIIGESWKFEFAVRICYAYLAIRTNRGEFEKFRKEFIKIYDILEKKERITDIICENMYNNEIAIGSSKPCFMILLDEISKMKNDSINLCSEVGIILDRISFGQYDALITSLDTTPLRLSTVTGSMRHLDWIPLKAPGFEIAMKLFPISEMTWAFITLLYLCSFHWRSLETIKQQEKELKTMNTYKEMANWIVGRIVGNPQLNSSDEPKICATLAAKYLPLNTQIHDLTLEKCIYHGYFVNTYSSTDTEVIPIMSTFLIERWTENQMSGTNHLASLLKDIFELDKHGPDCYTFEKFHGVWEAIRRYVFVKDGNDCTMNISQLYNGLGQKQKLNNQSIIIYKKMEPCYDYKDIKQLISIIYDKEKGGLRDTSLLHKVYILVGTNPGFDIVIFHKNVEGNRLIAITINTKFSTMGDVIQEITEINQNHHMTLNQFSQSERENVYFIAACWRKPRVYKNIPENTIILTKDNLSILYSSLRQRPQLGFNIEINHLFEQKIEGKPIE